MKYDTYQPEYKEIFEIETSDKAYEEMVSSSPFGYAQKKPEGGSISYDSHNQEYVSRFSHSTWALGYIVTMEELEDNLYRKVSFDRAGMLSFSMHQTKEINCSNVLNYGTTVAGGDGQPLFSTAHPTQSGSQSNRLTASADFSESALEDVIVAISLTKNSRGLIFKAVPRKLILHPSLLFAAERVLKSPLQADTASNSINAIKNLGLMTEGYTVNHFLNSSSFWAVQTSVQNCLTLFERKKLTFEQDNDFDSKNARASALERYVAGYGDFRGIYLGSS